MAIASYKIDFCTVQHHFVPRRSFSPTAAASMGGQSLPLFSFVLLSLTSYHIDDICGKHIMASVGDFSWVSATLSMAGISYTILCLHRYQKRSKNLKTKLSDTVGLSSDTPTF